MNSHQLQGRRFQNRSKNSGTISISRACDSKKLVSAVPPAVTKTLSLLFINSQGKRVFYIRPGLERCEWALIL